MVMLQSACSATATHESSEIVCSKFSLYSFERVNNIRICHECEGRIEKSVLRIAVWHHEACMVKSQISLSGVQEQRRS